MLSLATAAARRAYSPANLDDIFFRVTRMRLVAEILLVSIVSLFFFFLGGGGSALSGELVSTFSRVTVALSAERLILGINHICEVEWPGRFFYPEDSSPGGGGVTVSRLAEKT